MKTIIYSFFFGIFLGLVACNDEQNNVSTGFLYLGVEEDNTVIMTRAIKPITDELLRVDILSTSGDTVKSYADYSKEVRGQKLILPVGNYKVVVSSNKNGGAAWESPFYAGETEEPVAVKNGEITNTSVTCKIANTKVTVTYRESLKQHFIDYCDTVSTSAGKLVYTRDEYRAGYFTSEGNLTAKLYLKNKDGNEFTLQRIVKDIKPQYHYNLIYSLDDESEGEAGSDINISVDPNDPTEINCDISIKQEDLFGKGAPVLKVTGFEGEENKLTWKPIKKGEQQDLPDPEPILTLKAPAGIQNIKVNIGSTRFNEADLGIDTEKIVKEGQLINLNTLLEEAYKWNDLASVETHAFTITLLDNINQEVTISFSLVINPDLAVETFEENAFSTFVFFKGSSEETENLRFRYWIETDGESSAMEVNAIDAGDGTFRAIVTDLKPATKYKYKAIAGDTEGNTIDFITENAMALPGGDFSNWNGNTPTSNKDPFWNSGNNTFAEGLLTPEIIDENKVAKMQSQEAGLAGVVKFAAGNLFTGDFKMSALTQSGKITFNRTIDARPTKLKGRYRYNPKTLSGSYSGKFTLPGGDEIDMSEGATDMCSLYIVLANKEYYMDTNDKNSLFDMKMPKYQDLVVAYAELPDEDNIDTEDNFKPFSLTLKYLKPDYKGPYYIAIVCASSKYGDYFIGALGSILWVDDLEFEYSYDENCFN